MDGTISTTISGEIHICCHNGWHLLIMSIISLFNAFSGTADMKQMVNLQAHSKHNAIHIVESSNQLRTTISQRISVEIMDISCLIFAFMHYLVI